jgi:hypothetical protein
MQIFQSKIAGPVDFDIMRFDFIMIDSHNF